MTDVVIDVGSATWGGDASIPYLVEHFKPRYLYALDPAEEDLNYDLDGTEVIRVSAAAWKYDGSINFTVANLGGHIDSRGELTRCIDLASLIGEVYESAGTVLKIDAEGAEYDLCEHLIDQKVDKLLELAWIEWHCKTCRNAIWAHVPNCRDSGRSESERDRLEASLSCMTDRWER